MEIVGMVQLLHPLWTTMNHSCHIGWCRDYRGTRLDLVNCMRVTILTWMARRLPKAPKIEKSCSPEASECLAAMVFIRSSEPVNMLLTLLSVKHCKTRCLCPADQCQILRSVFSRRACQMSKVLLVWQSISMRWQGSIKLFFYVMSPDCPTANHVYIYNIIIYNIIWLYGYIYIYVNMIYDIYIHYFDRPSPVCRHVSNT